MKVILKQNVPKLGSKNDIVNTSDGFAFNYLIPRGLAVAATPQAIKNFQKQKDEHKEDLKNEARKWMEIKVEIESKEFVDFAKSREDVIVNNITRKHALEILNKELSVKLNKNQLPKEYLFGMGTNTYKIELFPHIIAVAKIIIKEK